jgi:DNA invertase Pin-like site-specific DNA recombinase
MLETLNLIEQLSQRGIKLIFVRQPELSTTGQHAKLLLAIYSYFAESERDFISTRTKQGLAASADASIYISSIIKRLRRHKNNFVALKLAQSVRRA